MLTPLIDFNREQAGESRREPIAIMLRDPDTGAYCGGLIGQISFDWLFVSLLFVPEAARGQDLGTRLLEQAEQLARAKGCLGLWLDTYSFQAPDFYLRRGFEPFGQIDDHPVGGRRTFFRKRLADQAAGVPSG